MWAARSPHYEDTALDSPDGSMSQITPPNDGKESSQPTSTDKDPTFTQLQQLIDLLPQLILVRDAEGRLLYADALPRLRDIGIIPEIMAGNIIGVVAQRLIRKLCKYCKSAYAPSEEELRLLSNDKGLVPEKIYKAKGCTSCDNTGYKGRMALLEILKMNSDLDDLLAHGATTKEIKDAAYKQGFFTLADDGVRHIIEGVTSIKEVARVADLTERMT